MNLSICWWRNERCLGRHAKKKYNCNTWILRLGGRKALSLSSLFSQQVKLLVYPWISSHVTFIILMFKPVDSFFIFWSNQDLIMIMTLSWITEIMPASWGFGKNCLGPHLHTHTQHQLNVWMNWNLTVRWQEYDRNWQWSCCFLLLADWPHLALWLHLVAWLWNTQEGQLETSAVPKWPQMP